MKTTQLTQTIQAEHTIERKMQRGYVEFDTREGMHIKNALEWSELWGVCCNILFIYCVALCTSWKINYTFVYIIMCLSKTFCCNYNCSIILFFSQDKLASFPGLPVFDCPILHTASDHKLELGNKARTGTDYMGMGMGILCRFNCFPGLCKRGN